jgi:pantoate--beta-alanine ligase
VRLAKPRAACTVVSIFVNRLQFGPREDYDRYPRTLESDCEKCREAGANVVFVPDEREIYPEPQTFVVEPSELQHVLDGAIRPGHFRGVATVVLKLFNMVRPHAALFGKKDYQQLLLIRAMVEALNFPVVVDAVPTVRESDGLALSSRNGRLSDPARQRAPALYQCLRDAAEACLLEPDQWPGIFPEILAKAEERLRETGFRPDYLHIRRAADLGEPGAGDRDLIVLGAAWLDDVRLIDNLRLGYGKFAVPGDSLIMRRTMTVGCQRHRGPCR